MEYLQNPLHVMSVTCPSPQRQGERVFIWTTFSKNFVTHFSFISSIFDKNFHKIFNIFIFEIEELEFHPPTLQVKYTLRWHISQALYQNNEFSKSSKDKKPFSDAQFFHFSVQNVYFFVISDPDH